jgi:hypothetical protein
LQNGASAVLAEQQLVAGQAVEAYPLPALAAWSKLVHPRRSSPRPPGLQAESGGFTDRVKELLKDAPAVHADETRPARRAGCGTCTWPAPRT